MSSFLIRKRLQIPVLASLLIVGVAPACKKTPSAPVPSELRIDVAEQPLPLAPAAAAATSLGHARVTNLGALLAEIRGLLPPELAAAWEEAALRGRVADLLEDPHALAAIDLQMPIAGVVFDPQEHSGTGQWPGVIAFAFKGGMPALLALEPKLPRLAAGTHAAHVDAHGTSVFVDALDGNYVALSGADLIFSNASPALRGGLIAPQTPAFGSAEVVVNLAQLYKTYAPQYLPMAKMAVAAASANQSAPAGADPQAHAAMQQVQAAQVAQLFETIAELRTLALGITVDSKSASLRFALSALPQAPRMQANAKTFTGKLDPTLLARLPASSVGVTTMYYDVAAALASDQWKSLQGLLTAYYAAVLSPESAKLIEPMMSMARALAPALAPHFAYGIWLASAEQGASVPCAVSLGKAAQGHDPRALLGQHLAPITEAINALPAPASVKASFESNAYVAQGISVARWSLELTPAGVAKINEKLGAEVWPAVQKALGGSTYTIDIAQVGDLLVITTAMAPLRTATERVLAGVITGNETLAGRAEFNDLVAHFSGNSLGLALDAKASLAWIRKSIPNNGLGDLEVGEDLRDVMITARAVPEGHVSYDVRSSSAFVRKVFELAAK